MSVELRKWCSDAYTDVCDDDIDIAAKWLALISTVVDKWDPHMDEQQSMGMDFAWDVFKVRDSGASLGRRTSNVSNCCSMRISEFATEQMSLNRL